MKVVLPGVSADNILLERSADLRYRGQSTALTLAWENSGNTATAFHAAHEQRYGHRLDLPIELVNLRVAVRAPRPDLYLPAIQTGDEGAAISGVRIFGIDSAVAVWERTALHGAQWLRGPALITDSVSTTYLAPGWQCCRDDDGNLLLEKYE